MRTSVFIENYRVNNAIIDLNQHFEQNELIVSDIIEEQGNQYVDFVQEVVEYWG